MFKYEPHYQARRDAEAALVDHIKSLINHYKKEEAGGIMFIKDPLKTNSFQEKFSGMTMKFEDTKLYGLRYGNGTIDIHGYIISYLFHLFQSVQGGET